MDISCVIIAKNEENNLKDCIASVSFCNEIIVIDDYSDDKTVSIAKKEGAKVITHSLEKNFSAQRNFGLSKTKNDWVLFIDADERVSKNLKNEIIKVISQNSLISGYYIKRDDFMWGKFLKHGESGNIFFLRLVKKHTGIWTGKVHEKWVSSEPTLELKFPLLHYPHVNTKEFLKEINFYSTIRAEELFEKKEKTNFISLISYPGGKFLQNYIFKLGFLDGIPGILFALFMSFHSFLVRAKLWLLYDKK